MPELMDSHPIKTQTEYVKSLSDMIVLLRDLNKRYSQLNHDVHTNFRSAKRMAEVDYMTLHQKAFEGWDWEELKSKDRAKPTDP